MTKTWTILVNKCVYFGQLWHKAYIGWWWWWVQVSIKCQDINTADWTGIGTHTKHWTGVCFLKTAQPRVCVNCMRYPDLEVTFQSITEDRSSGFKTVPKLCLLQDCVHSWDCTTFIRLCVILKKDMWPIYLERGPSGNCSPWLFYIPPSDDYGTLLLAEALLEESLQENMDPLRSSTPLMDKMQPKLCRAKSYLNIILSRGRLSVSQHGCLSRAFHSSLNITLLTFANSNNVGKNPQKTPFKTNLVFPPPVLLFQPRYLNEALLLMAKVHYVQGRHRDAQGMCARVGLEELTQDDQPTYHLRLLAEAFVIKGAPCIQSFPNIHISNSIDTFHIFTKEIMGHAEKKVVRSQTQIFICTNNIYTIASNYWYWCSSKVNLRKNWVFHFILIILHLQIILQLKSRKHTHHKDFSFHFQLYFCNIPTLENIATFKELQVPKI